MKANGINKVGFENLKPFSHYDNKYSNKASVMCNYEIGGMRIMKSNSISDLYKEWIIRNSPYSFFITLTFGKNIGRDKNKLYQYTNYFFHRYNRLMFTEKYRQRNHFLDGFAFYENHYSSKFDNEGHIHIHLLIKYNEIFDKKSFTEHEAIFRKATSKICDDKDRLVFSNECINIKVVRDDNIIGYCMKNMWDANMSRVKTIDVNGISDNL